jgi:intermediate cleaving peptidase 55
MFVKPKEPYDELWNGAKTGIDGACQVFGADDVRILLVASSFPSYLTFLLSQAVDSTFFPTRLRTLLSSSSGPVYIDLPSVSSSSTSRARAAQTPKRSFLSYLSGPSGSAQSETDEFLEALGKRELRSAAREVERLRLIKSEAEVKVMRKAADMSCAAHSKVRFLPSVPPYPFPSPSSFPFGL